MRTRSEVPSSGRGRPTVSINVPLPREVHEELRVAAVRSGHHMKDKVVLILAEQLGISVPLQVPSAR